MLFFTDYILKINKLRPFDFLAAIFWGNFITVYPFGFSAASNVIPWCNLLTTFKF